jgi:hypothetical protein
MVPPLKTMIGDFSVPDPCSLGPINCAFGACNGATDIETMSIFGGSQGKAAKLNQPPMTPTGRLMKRISDYQVKGWLSQQEHRKYVSLLSSSTASKQQHQNNNVDENAAPTVASQVIQELEKQLDDMEARFGGGALLNRTTRIASNISSNISNNILTPSNRSTERPHGFSVFPEPKSAINPQQNKGRATNNGNQVDVPPARSSELIPLVVDPEELHNAVDLTNTEIQELFTEMCFFARLGFVQPPCCLRCTYRESMKEAVPNTSCNKWVVWRKNAQTLLHPNQMGGNIMVVQCQAARRLLAGETIGPYKWDKNKKVLMQEDSV